MSPLPAWAFQSRAHELQGRRKGAAARFGSGQRPVAAAVTAACQRGRLRMCLLKSPRAQRSSPRPAAAAAGPCRRETCPSCPLFSNSGARLLDSVKHCATGALHRHFAAAAGLTAPPLGPLRPPADAHTALPAKAARQVTLRPCLWSCHVLYVCSVAWMVALPLPQRGCGTP